MICHSGQVCFGQERERLAELERQKEEEVGDTCPRYGDVKSPISVDYDFILTGNHMFDKSTPIHLLHFDFRSSYLCLKM